MREHNRVFKVISLRSSRSKVKPVESKETSEIVCLPQHLQWQLDTFLSKEIADESEIARRLYDLLRLAMRHCGGHYYKVLIDESPFIVGTSESSFIVTRIFVEIFLDELFPKVEAMILLPDGTVNRPHQELWTRGLVMSHKVNIET
ncbi:MAG: hypothetical protein WCX74_01645 [Candidatus Paceibacterota bacterium]